jgi:YidC/Oxa1 family membrane protein insertase
MKNQQDSANWMLAMVLCVAVIFAWEYFYAWPMQEAQRKAAEQAKLEQQSNAPTVPGVPAAPGAAPAAAAAATIQPREAVLAASGARLAFDNGKIDGTIKLTGGAIDDLRLRDYRETLDPASPEIVFLTPEGSEGATFATVGWTAAGTNTPVPGPNTVWTASAAKLSATTPVTLTWDNGQGLRFVRTIALDDNYMFTITDKVENTSASPVTLYPYASVTRNGQPKHPVNWMLHEGMLGVMQGILRNETTYDEMRAFENGEMKLDSTGGWLGLTDKYWMAMLIPPQKEKFDGRFSYAKQGEAETFRGDYLLGPRNIAAGSTSTVTHHIFAGAKVVSLIEGYQKKLGIERFDMTMDWGWFSFFTYWIFIALDFFNKLVGNFGVAIILLTIVLKGLFFPLQNRAYESMTKMKKVQPLIQELKERHKNDAMALQREQVALFQREKINPLMGCLPILLQIPIFFSLFKVLFVTIEMRHAPFFGWIQDLSAGDPTSFINLFGLLPFAVPVWLQIGVWPLLMGITMWIQMKMSPPAGDPVQQQVMQFMPIMFTYMMAQFSAGLVIYWTVNNVLSILQQYLIMRRLNVPIEIFDNFKWPPWLGGKSAKG